MSEFFRGPWWVIIVASVAAAIVAPFFTASSEEIAQATTALQRRMVKKEAESAVRTTIGQAIVEEVVNALPVACSQTADNLLHDAQKACVTKHCNKMDWLDGNVIGCVKCCIVTDAAIRHALKCYVYEY